MLGLLPPFQCPRLKANTLSEWLQFVLNSWHLEFQGMEYMLTHEGCCSTETLCENVGPILWG